MHQKMADLRVHTCKMNACERFRPTINFSVDFSHSLSLERTGDAAAEARDNRRADSWRSLEGTIPGRSARSRYAAVKSLISKAR